MNNKEESNFLDKNDCQEPPRKIIRYQEDLYSSSETLPFNLVVVKSEKDYFDQDYTETEPIQRGECDPLMILDTSSSSSSKVNSIATNSVKTEDEIVESESSNSNNFIQQFNHNKKQANSAEINNGNIDQQKSKLSCSSANTRHSQPTKLRDFLETQSEGRMIVRFYDDHNSLDNKKRSLLSRIIIKREVDVALERASNHQLEEFTVPTSKLMILSKEIQQTFPKEDTSVYFTKYESLNGKKLNPSGKLYNVCAYYVSKMRKNKVLKPSRKHTDRINNDLTVMKSEKLTQLGFIVEPWDMVVKLWDETFEERRQLLTQKTVSVIDYFQSCPCLYLTEATQLFVADFSRIYSNPENDFMENWTNARQFLIQKLSNTKITDPEDLHIFKSLSMVPPEKQDALLFWLLPYLMPYDRLKQRLSSDEKRNLFVINVESSISIETALESAIKSLENLNINHRPVPVFVGPLNNVTAFYIVLNDKSYKVTSAAEAFALTIKIYLSLNCEYPSNARLSWIFLQRAFFKINTVEKVPIAIRTLIGEINALNN